ncbi:MAG: 1-deoxy-D-xylulose-5-phosphate reductoisomerase, partial [Candidatus Omnitrophica bacterium]|nr:1-deoxy-D-xylulose-5-phosphate reductoisomerase [Candidatus Omnitrophota bacterium]
MRRRVAVLGSTGSIGKSALDVISRLEQDLEVVALSADSNISCLAAEARSFRPRIVTVGNERLIPDIKRLLPRGVRVREGREGLNEIVSRADVDIVVMAISGTACIEPLIKAMECGKRIALANKEALVSAGPIIMALASRKKATIIPVDSEHSAIFQCIDRAGESDVSKIYLTGSGGPLLDVPKKDFDKMSSSRVLNHPKWKMGKKISVDSATMMNKGLEIIEAKYLFGVNDNAIEVLIHPEAIIHS